MRCFDLPCFTDEAAVHEIAIWFSKLLDCKHTEWYFFAHCGELSSRVVNLGHDACSQHTKDPSWLREMPENTLFRDDSMALHLSNTSVEHNFKLEIPEGSSSW